MRQFITDNAAKLGDSELHRCRHIRLKVNRDDILTILTRLLPTGTNLLRHIRHDRKGGRSPVHVKFGHSKSNISILGSETLSLRGEQQQTITTECGSRDI